MNYHQFKRFMWFPLLRRFLWSWSAFKYAWNHVHPTDHWTQGYYPWLRDNLEFKVGDFDYIKGREGVKGKPLPDGIEPFMMKKMCTDEEGRIRYFDVVPEGYERFDTYGVKPGYREK